MPPPPRQLRRPDEQDDALCARFQATVAMLAPVNADALTAEKGPVPALRNHDIECQLEVGRNFIELCFPNFDSSILF